MKKIILLLSSVFLVWLIFNGFSIDKEKKISLEMQGVIKQSGVDASLRETNADSVIICIQDEAGNTADTLYSARSGKCDLFLPLGRTFIISFSKKGFVEKKISVDTRVPDNPEKHFEFAFDLTLFASIEDVDIASLVQQPVASVYFSVQKKYFDYRKEYTDGINRLIKKMYSDYYSNLPPASGDPKGSSSAVQKPDFFCCSGNILFSGAVVSGIHRAASSSYIFPGKNLQTDNSSGKKEEYFSNGIYKYRVLACCDNEAAGSELGKILVTGCPGAFPAESVNEKQLAVRDARECGSRYLKSPIASCLYLQDIIKN